jgi:hypothetical protein
MFLRMTDILYSDILNDPYSVSQPMNPLSFLYMKLRNSLGHTKIREDVFLDVNHSIIK